MKRFLKLLLGLVGAVVVLLLLAAVILPLIIDPNDYKDRIEALASERTGLEFTIGDEIGWSVFPWVGIEAGAVELGNADGYRQPYLARIDALQARVKLLPLISGRVEIDTITLTGMDLRAEVDAAGRGNWEVLLERLQSSDETSAESESEAGLVLQIAGLELERSTLVYAGPEGALATIDDLSVSTGAIEPPQPLDVQAAMQLEVEGLPSAMDIAITATVTPAEVAEARIEEAEAVLDWDGTPVRLTLLDPLQWRADSGQIQAPVSLVAGKMTASVNANVSGLQGTPTIAADIDVPTFDPRDLIQTLTGSAVRTNDPSVLQQLAISADLALTGDRLTLKDLKVQLDDTTLEGQIELSSLSALAGTVNGRLDRIDIDRYLPPASDAPAGSDAGPAPTGSDDLVIPGRIDGVFEVGSLKVAGLSIENGRVELLIRNGGLRLYPLSADLYGGTLTGALSIRPPGEEHRLVFKNSLKDVDTAALLGDLSGQPILGGLGTVAFEFYLGDPGAPNPLQTLDGGMEIRFREGKIYGVDVMGMIRQAAAMLSPGSESSPDLKPDTDFTELIVSADIASGVLSTKRLSLKAPYFSVSGSGSVDLAGQTLDYTLSPVLEGVPEGQGASSLGKLKGLAIPVRLRGSLLQPEWDIDARKLLLASQRDKLDGPAGQLLEALTGDSESGEQKDSGAALLDALLNEASRRKDKKKDDDKDQGS